MRPLLFNSSANVLLMAAVCSTVILLLAIAWKCPVLVNSHGEVIGRDTNAPRTAALGYRCTRVVDVDRCQQISPAA